MNTLNTPMNTRIGGPRPNGAIRPLHLCECRRSVPSEPLTEPLASRGPSRDIALSSNAALGAAYPEARDQLCEVAVAFPIAFMLHMWGGAAPGRAEAFEAMVDGVFAQSATRVAIAGAAHRPLALIQHGESVLHDLIFGGTAGKGMSNAPLQAQLYEQVRAHGSSGHGSSGHWSGSGMRAHWSGGLGAAPHPPGTQRSAVSESLLRVLGQLLRSIQGLGVPLGGCERIQGTPLPFVYVAHLRTFLLIVLWAVPIVYACEWGWATFPLSLLVAIALLGIEAASIECERPFSAKPSKNHHDVERFCELLSNEVRDMLTRSRLRTGGHVPQPPLPAVAVTATSTDSITLRREPQM